MCKVSTFEENVMGGMAKIGILHSSVWSDSTRDESGVDNFRIRSDVNPNYVNMEKSFLYPCGCR
jgi:hypothetical protein